MPTARFSPAEQAQPAPGLRFASYELVRQIGKGGMGAVFLARDLKLGRRVAIKFLAVSNELLARRFIVEARTTARCVHENIVVIHEVASLQGVPYMVLEYLEGETLGAVMRRTPRMTLAAAIDYLLPVARALVCAHAAAITHRDLKPENIFITRQGGVKVLDFGIAKRGASTGEAAEGARDSVRDFAIIEQLDAGRVLGTEGYMAPEQWTGGTIDGRTDVFAWGVIAFRALSGSHPSRSRSLTEISASSREVARPFESLATLVPSLPPSIIAIVDRALDKRLENRPHASEIIAAITSHDLRTAPAARETTCPFPGLGTFTAADAARFFGRDNEIRRAAEMVERLPFVAVLGQSGSGKSSFVFAGLLPNLQRGDVDVATFRPTRRPLHALLASLRALPGFALAADPDELATAPGLAGEALRAWCRGHRRSAVIVIDQFEELFALRSSPEERVTFLAVLMALADDVDGPVRVIATLRSDFLHAAGAYPALATRITDGALLLGPLDRAGLREALERPLEQREYHFEHAGTCEEIVAACAADPHALPILQAVATELWAHRDRTARTIPREAVAAIGGVSGALARHADSVLSALPVGYRSVARAILLRLVTTQDTRIAAERTELERLDPAAGFVIAALIAARLVVAQDDVGTVELVHEVLTTGWPQLACWIAESREDRLVRERIAAAAAAWDARGRHRGMAWPAEAVSEVHHLRAELPPRDREFLEASERTHRRARRRRRFAVASVVVVAVAAAVVFGFGFTIVRHAEHAAREEARRATSEADRSAAAERDLAEKVRALEAAERARTEADQLASSRKRALDANADELRAALQKAEALSVQLRAALAQEQTAHDKERATRAALEKALAREQERVRVLEKNRAKIIDKL